MNVSILGTGNMAKAIGRRMLAGGNSVIFYSRDPQKAAELVKELAPDGKNGASVKVAKLGSPLQDPVVISTIWYGQVQQVIKDYGQQLSGKIFVDVTNPLNQTYDDLITPPGSSAAEELAKIAPKDTRVLKAFNTTFAGMLNQGHLGGEPVDVFIAGDEQSAKDTLAELASAGGLHPIDAGPLRRARQLESLQLLVITLQGKLDKPWMSVVKLLS